MRGEDPEVGVAGDSDGETPPRAWGRLRVRGQIVFRDGNTPTGVGKTGVIRAAWLVTWKHPHGRGEDFDGTFSVVRMPETPPRAWGRPEVIDPHDGMLGNTPTGVGKTSK